MNKPPPRSCDTFVALPPATNNPNTIIFGKNSDRPDDEVQEVVAYPAATYSPGSTVDCTYITIDQAPKTHAVVLSKPIWMWGAEMAANEHGLVIGNEAVWTTEPDDGPEALLGMDLVRLAAERCTTSLEAVETIAELLQTHGQGGGCEEGGSWSYHNSFLIADRFTNKAYVMETADKLWVAEEVTAGVRNISNCLSIRSNYSLCHPSISLTDRIDWAATYSSSGAPSSPSRKTPGREASGYELLVKSAASDAKVTVEAMMNNVLRNKESGICMTGGGFTSTGSMVSLLDSSSGEDVHWFTGTPDPSKSAYKPFMLSSSVGTTMSSRHTTAPSKKQPHGLWVEAERARRAAARNPALKKKLYDGLKAIEQDCLNGSSRTVGCFAEACEREMALYQSIT